MFVLISCSTCSECGSTGFNRIRIIALDNVIIPLDNVIETIQGLAKCYFNCFRSATYGAW